jgi:hypothetical protein
MFESNSRYFNLPIASLTVLEPDGQPRVIRYVRRRFLPPPTGSPTLVEHRVAEGERIDVITARYLTDPTQFWHVCDTNTVLRPNEATETTGRLLRIELPGF